MKERAIAKECGHEQSDVSPESVEILRRFMEKYEQTRRSRGEKAEKEKEMSSNVMSEMEGYVCPICYEWMLPPNRSPMICFPCGHSLCSVCLACLSFQKCPLCRASIQSSAVNVPLQNLLSFAAAQRKMMGPDARGSSSSAKDGDGGDVRRESGGSSSSRDKSNDEQKAKYEQEIEMLTARIEILREEKEEMGREEQEWASKAHSAQMALDHLAQEKQRLQEELALLQRSIGEQEQKVWDLEQKAGAAQKRSHLIDDTVSALVTQLEKSRLLLRHFSSGGGEVSQ